MRTIWTAEKKQAALDCLASWHGVPHMDRRAVPGVGVDCLHLLHEVYKAADLLPAKAIGFYDVARGIYERSTILANAFEAALHCDRFDPEETDPEFGDAIVFRTGAGMSAHVAIYVKRPGSWGGGEIWHSMARHGVLCAEWNLYRGHADTIIRLTAPGFKADPRRVIASTTEETNVG